MPRLKQGQELDLYSKANQIEFLKCGELACMCGRACLNVYLWVARCADD